MLQVSQCSKGCLLSLHLALTVVSPLLAQGLSIVSPVEFIKVKFGRPMHRVRRCVAGVGVGVLWARIGVVIEEALVVLASKVVRP